jgi:large subunit ribosomal protein L25
MAGTITLTLEPRTLMGKKVKQLRKEGIIPVHLYGRGVDSQSLQCDGKTLLGVLTQAGMNTPIAVTITGQKRQELAFVREIQWAPLRGEMFHVDFLRVEASAEVTAFVPVTLTGESPAARLTRGAVVQQLREVAVQALPLDMPSELTADLAMIAEPADVIRVSGLNVPPTVTLITDSEEAVARFEVAREEAAEGEAEQETPAGDEG